MAQQNHPSLEDVKKYYQLVKLEKKSKEEAASQLEFRRRHTSDAVKIIENSDLYKMVSAAMDQATRTQLREEMTELKRAKVKAYKSLLDKGEEIMGEAENLEAQLKAQENQRRNLDVDVIERSRDWDGDTRNQQDHGDALEGVIIL